MDREFTHKLTVNHHHPLKKGLLSVSSALPKFCIEKFQFRLKPSIQTHSITFIANQVDFLVIGVQVLKLCSMDIEFPELYPKRWS